MRNLCMSILVLVSLCSGAMATIVNVDIMGDQPGATPVATMSGAAAIGAAGDVWNEFRGVAPASPVTITGLVDSAGNATGMTFTFTNGTLAYPVGSTPLASTYGCLAGVGATGDIVITGLPANTAVDLYLYTCAGLPANMHNQFAGFTFGGVSKYPTAVSGAMTWVENDNYVLFTDVMSDATGTIAGQMFVPAANTTAGPWAAFNGVQIEYVPEPATIGLLSVGGLWLVRRSRK